MYTTERAGEPWCDNEKTSLERGWVKLGYSIGDLSFRHKRTVGAIAAQLSKLGLLNSHSIQGVRSNSTALSLGVLTTRPEHAYLTETSMEENDMEKTQEQITNLALNLTFRGWYGKTDKGWVRFPSTEGEGKPLPETWHSVKNPVTDKVISVKVLEVQNLCPIEELEKRLPFVMENGSEVIHKLRLNKEAAAEEKIKEALHARILREKKAELQDATGDSSILNEVAQDMAKITMEDIMAQVFKELNK